VGTAISCRCAWGTKRKSRKRWSKSRNSFLPHRAMQIAAWLLFCLPGAADSCDFFQAFEELPLLGTEESGRPLR
jgi:hypothetical protein